MKTLLLLLILICAFDIAQAQWVNRHTSTEINFTGVDMVNSLTAYAVGSTTGTCVAKTTDGGFNWTSTVLSASNIIMYDIEFLNIFSGFIVGQSGVIYKTSTSGTNWLLMPTGTTQAFKEVDIVNISTIIAGGDNGMVRRTTNGGTPWEIIDVPANTSCTGLDFINAQTGFAVFSQTIYKTTDEGETWQATPLSQLYHIEMFNHLTGYATGYNSTGYVYKTTNTGANWNLVATGLPPALDGTHFTSANTGYVYGFNSTSYIAKTTNGGVNWYRQSSTAITRVANMDFASPDTGMAVGGTIVMFTGNAGGLTSVNLTSSEIPSRYILSQNYPNPFNPVTNFEFAIADFGFVTLKVYDVQGKEIRTLVSKDLQAGVYKAEFDASDITSGVYFYRLEAGNFTETKRMLLLK